MRLGLVIGLAVAAGACSASSKSTPSSSGSGDSVTVFVTTEVKGQIEPCGCTSDPMGDLARTAALVAGARRDGAVVVLDSGSLLYTELTPKPAQVAQEQLKADLLAAAFRDHLHAAAVGLGPYDLAAGPANVRPARQAANVGGAGVAIEAPKVIEAGGVKIGVFGVVAPELVAPHGVTATDPAPAAKAAVASLRKGGAEIVVGLVHMDRAGVKQLVRDVPGIDVAVVGANAPEPDRVERTPDRVGDTWLVQSANRGQVITRLDITARGAGPLSDAIGEARAEQEIAAIDERLERIRADIAKLDSDPNADPDFVAMQNADLTDLERRRAELVESPLRVPAKGSYFVMSQVPIKKMLPCSEAIVKQKAEYDEAVGKANLAAAKSTPVPPAPEGTAGYAGMSECGYCHKEAVEFWKQTKHASAWKTLADAGKQYNLECVYCHATGFGAPGGSNLAVLAEPPEDESLRDAQCEVCHGPASLHIDADGKEQPSSLVLRTPKDTCVVCHNALHSDTFDYEAYLRDMTGPGHGEAFRKSLGDGPTGHELRAAALKKAGSKVGAGCPK
jgi:hypothetical protein